VWDLNSRPRCSSGWRQCVPHTARPLRSADVGSPVTKHFLLYRAFDFWRCEHAWAD
jgi:hypothetical protein